MRIKRPCFIVLLVLLGTLAVHAQETAVSKPAGASQLRDLNARLPIDPDIVVGRLHNGITYYIQRNRRPEQRAELRLAVNAGSVIEDDDQCGLAHFTEHMAFNGTKNFKKQELVNYLESIGMRFGPELNAYTSFDETTYLLTIPTDQDSIVRTAFQILEDWAHNQRMDDDEIDKERGVIIEEWRLGRGAEARMRDKQFPILLKDSRYAERLVIGKKEILESFKHETLKRFYRDWYRPGLMAVIAVGDFDMAKIEQLIKDHFSRIPAGAGRTRTVFPVPDHAEPLFAIATDPEATMSLVGVYYKHATEPSRTIADYHTKIVEALYDGMFNNRLQELAKLADPPFLSASSRSGRFVRSKDVYTLSSAVKDNGIERGLHALLIEAARVKRYGFTATELERQKKEKLRAVEQAFNERDKTESRILAMRCVSNFLSEEPVCGPAIDYELYQEYLPGITLDEVNKLASVRISDENRVVMVNGPEKKGVKIPTREELMAIFAAVEKEDIKPYEDKVSELPLVSNAPAPGSIIQEKIMKDLGVTEWKLSNGVRIVLKPTDFKNDEVMMTAYSPGGSSLAEDRDFVPASTASQVAVESGVGGFDQIALRKLLQGKIVNVVPRIGELQEGFLGTASPKDIETMMQLVYLYFTEPRADSTAFLSFKQRMKGFLQNRSANPEAALEDTLGVTLAQYHKRRLPVTEETLDKMDLDRSSRIFRDRFADASDFTFIIDGAFKLDEIKGPVTTYLGGLPSKSRKETWRDVGVTAPKGVIVKTVKRGIEPKSQVRIVFTGPFEWKRENRHALQSLASVLRIKLREQMREEKGGTYGVGVGAVPIHFPRPEYRITISWGCSPDRVQELINTAMAQIDSVRDVGVAESYTVKVRESERREMEVSLKENRFWLSSLEFAYWNGEDPNDILRYQELIEKVAPDMIRAAARKYLDKNNLVEVVLYPAEK